MWLIDCSQSLTHTSQASLQTRVLPRLCVHLPPHLYNHGDTILSQLCVCVHLNVYVILEKSSTPLL